ncbi:MAG: hypothetical protein LBP33_11490, partial [Candidatus Adiutrix sp.]|nr:hypothetical protein [Candidatus Adiutrix sp.]
MVIKDWIMADQFPQKRGGLSFKLWGTLLPLIAVLLLCTIPATAAMEVPDRQTEAADLCDPLSVKQTSENYLFIGCAIRGLLDENKLNTLAETIHDKYKHQKIKNVFMLLTFTDPENNSPTSKAFT